MSLRRTTLVVASCVLAGAMSRSPAGQAAGRLPAGNMPRAEPATLALPAAGTWSLSAVTESMLELSFVTKDTPDPVSVSPADFQVRINGRRVRVARSGVKRRVQWAALRTPDRRVGTWFYLEIDTPVQDGDVVVVSHASGGFPNGGPWTGRIDASQTSSVVHVSQAGYLTRSPKRAFIGLYLGTMGELPLPGITTFTIETADGREVMAGGLTLRADRGMPGASPAYQHVLQGDFSTVETPGIYRLRVPGLGVSLPFRIDDGTAALMARTYALGVYHERCGEPNALPFTRDVHDACHLDPAEIPEAGHAPSLDARLEGATSAVPGNPRHTAPRLRRLSDARYPAVKGGHIDVRGGHHDAGDYGKYAIDSALFIHNLVFAADAFPGVAALDNLGLPESGDGIGDLLQLARWEADFLARLQDSDGGFFFLVQPRDRSYEQDVLPDHGDPQIVFPKNTSATASAVAALAQAASSPAFSAAFPADAARYLAAARRGWAFLLRAWAAHGRLGAYQTVTPYGDVFEDRDEIAWAATEMFLATGDQAAHALVLAEFDPLAGSTKRWGWWAMFEGYGAAARSYAFAADTRRSVSRSLDAIHLERCREAVRAWGLETANASRDSAYGTSYPDASKRGLLAGWYFGEDALFDLVSARRLSDDARLDAAIADNLAYTTGANPSNMSFVTGLGDRWPRELVSQYAQNDRRALPPSGFPFGNLQQGVPFLGPHGEALRQASLPPDEGVPAPYAIYDRFSDVFDTSAEATILTQSRALAAAAALMATTPAARQRYTSLPSRIGGLPAVAAAGEVITLELIVEGLDATTASVVWEAGGEPVRGTRMSVAFATPGPAWVEVEAVWPDGRRAFATATLSIR